MPGYIGVGGVWKELTGMHIGISSSWVEVLEAWVGVGGAWEQWYSVDVTVPAPTGLNVTTTGVSTASITWNTVSGADGYRLERSLTGTFGGEETEVYDDTTASYDDSSLDDGTLYYYRVQAYIGSIDSSWSSSENDFTTIKTPVLTSATKIDDDSASLVLTDGGSVSETFIRVYLSTTGSGSGFSLFKSLSPNTINDTLTGLDEETQHWIKLTNWNAVAGESGDSSIRTFTTDASLPGDGPTDITVIPRQGTDHRVTINWTAVIASTNHDVYLSLSTPATSGTPVGGSIETGPIIVDVASLLGAGPDDQIFCNIRGTNSGGDGPWGDESNGYTHVQVPQSFHAGINLEDCPTINFDIGWNNLNTDNDVRSETMTLQRDDGGGYANVSTNISGGSTSYYDTGGSASTVGYRLKYNSEGVYATDTVFNPGVCPE